MPKLFTTTRGALKTQLQADDWIYLCTTSAGRWGKGFTIDQAKHAAQVKRGDRYVVQACTDPWAVIDGGGGIIYTPRQVGPDAPPTYVTAETYTD